MQSVLSIVLTLTGSFSLRPVETGALLDDAHISGRLCKSPKFWIGRFPIRPPTHGSGLPFEQWHFYHPIFIESKTMKINTFSLKLHLQYCLSVTEVSGTSYARSLTGSDLRELSPIDLVLIFPGQFFPNTTISSITDQKNNYIPWQPYH